MVQIRRKAFKVRRPCEPPASAPEIARSDWRLSVESRRPGAERAAPDVSTADRYRNNSGAPNAKSGGDREEPPSILVIGAPRLQ